MFAGPLTRIHLSAALYRGQRNPLDEQCRRLNKLETKSRLKQKTETMTTTIIIYDKNNICRRRRQTLQQFNYCVFP